MEKQGIKEIKEVVVAANELSIFLIKQLKDGIQLADGAAVVAKLTSDEDFKAKMGAAFENIQAVPAEVADIDVQEAVELAMTEFAYVPKIVEAFKA